MNITLATVLALTTWFCKFLAKENWRKSCSYNVNKIDYRVMTSQWL